MILLMLLAILEIPERYELFKILAFSVSESFLLTMLEFKRCKKEKQDEDGSKDVNDFFNFFDFASDWLEIPLEKKTQIVNEEWEEAKFVTNYH